MVRKYQLRQLIPLAIVCAACVDGNVSNIDFTVDTHVDDWRDEVIYQVLVDRFANGSRSNDFRVDPDPRTLARYKGGDWQGLIDRLDYIEELGVTALWISPIIMNVDTDAGFDGYHGYWAINLERLNPHFGDLATLRTLVDECHERDIKVVLDIVTNHLGQVFYYDINQNGRPDEFLEGGFPSNPGDPMAPPRTPVRRITEYDPDYDERGIQSVTSLGEAGPAPIRFFDMPDIFRVPPHPAIFQRREAYNLRGKVTDWNNADHVVFGDFPGGLKDINTENSEVRDEMIRVYTDWVLKLDLDGFRIDTLKHVEHGYWVDFTRRVRERLAASGKTNFLMFGEAFDGDDALVGSFTMPGELDSVFYFPQKFQVFDDVFGNGGPTANIQRLHDARAINYGSEAQAGGIGASPQQSLVNFIDNHDVPRFLWNNSDTRALRAALGYLLTEDGIPCLYYGTEQEFAGGNDPANREMLWQSEYRTDGETFRWIARLIETRTRYAALRRGTTTIRWSTERTGDESDAGIIGFERATGDDYALVVINAQGVHASRTSFEGTAMEVGHTGGLVDVLTGDRFNSDGTLDLEVDPYATRILVPAADYVAE